MHSLSRLALALSLLALPLLLMGCQKEEPVKDSPAIIEADAKAAGGAPAQPLPPAAQEQMSKALNDPNTPPEVKAKIKAQLGGGGQ